MPSMMLSVTVATLAVAGASLPAVEGRQLKQFAVGATALATGTGVSDAETNDQTQETDGTAPYVGDIGEGLVTGTSTEGGSAVGESTALAESGTYDTQAIAYNTQESAGLATSRADADALSLNVVAPADGFATAASSATALGGAAESTAEALANGYAEAEAEATSNAYSEATSGVANSDADATSEIDGDAYALAATIAAESASATSNANAQGYETAADAEAISTGTSFGSATTNADSIALSLVGTAVSSSESVGLSEGNAESEIGEGGDVDAEGSSLATGFLLAESAQTSLATVLSDVEGAYGAEASGTSEATAGGEGTATATSSSTAINTGK